MEGKDAVTIDKFVFMIDKEVEILAKQRTSHLKPSDTSPLGDDRGIWIFRYPGPK